MIDKRRLQLQTVAMLLILLLLTMGGCATTPTKGQSGAAVGAAAGALAGQAIGRNTEGTLIGLALGGLIGYIVGNEMDKYDRARLSQVLETSPSNHATKWVNPDTKNSYTVTPKPAYTGSSGRTCREAEIHATVEGRPEKVVSTACRDNKGRWVIEK